MRLKFWSVQRCRPPVTLDVHGHPFFFFEKRVGSTPAGAHLDSTDQSGTPLNAYAVTRVGFQHLAPAAKHSPLTGPQQLNSPGASRRRPL